MADIELIIKIPKEVYEKQRYSQYFGAWSVVLQKCFENSTPLTEVLDKIKADIEQYQADCDLSCSDDGNCKTCNNITFGSIYRIIDKYRKESEEI